MSMAARSSETCRTGSAQSSDIKVRLPGRPPTIFFGIGVAGELTSGRGGSHSNPQRGYWGGLPMKRLVLIIAAVLTGTTVALAESEEGRQACMQDAFKFCSDAIPDRERVFQCLASHQDVIRPHATRTWRRRWPPSRRRRNNALRKRKARSTNRKRQNVWPWNGQPQRSPRYRRGTPRARWPPPSMLPCPRAIRP
jgi:hypothetical protein